MSQNSIHHTVLTQRALRRTSERPFLNPAGHSVSWSPLRQLRIVLLHSATHFSTFWFVQLRRQIQRSMLVRKKTDTLFVTETSTKHWITCLGTPTTCIVQSLRRRVPIRQMSVTRLSMRRGIPVPNLDVVPTNLRITKDLTGNDPSTGKRTAHTNKKLFSEEQHLLFEGNPLWTNSLIRNVRIQPPHQKASHRRRAHNLHTLYEYYDIYVKKRWIKHVVRRENLEKR
jgi:hypothetical protein